MALFAEVLKVKMKDSFNSNFYITTAAVAPLLYITLFLQGQTIQDLAKEELTVKHTKTYNRLVERSLDKWEGGKFPIKQLFWQNHGRILIGIFSGGVLVILIVTAFSGIVAEGAFAIGIVLSVGQRCDAGGCPMVNAGYC